MVTKVGVAKGSIRVNRRIIRSLEDWRSITTKKNSGYDEKMFGGRWGGLHGGFLLFRRNTITSF